MDISANDIHAIAEKLRAALAGGNELFTYNLRDYYATKDNLSFFRDRESFHRFVKDNYPEQAPYFEMNTQRVLDAVDRIISGNSDGDVFDKSVFLGYADGVYAIYDPMHMKNIQSLKDQMLDLGFSSRLFSALSFYDKHPVPQFNLLQRERNENEKQQYSLHFEQDENKQIFRLKSYEAALRIAPEIPDVTVNGISARELDTAMKSIDWSIDHHRDSLVEEYIKTADGNDFLDRLDMITRDVNRLYKSNVEGKDAAERLMYKHWYGEPWEPTEISLEHVRKIYEWKKEVDLVVTPGKGVLETYEALKQNAVLRNGALPLNKEELQVCLGDDLGEIKRGEELVTLARHFYKVNTQRLETELYEKGWDDPLDYELQWYFNNRSECFDITVNKKVQEDKMQCRLQFEDAGNGWYLFKQFDATLYHQVVVAHDHINGINTNYLEAAMKKADWYYEYSESNGAWDKGFAEVRKINDALNTLCQDQTGRIIATQLWNNHVPLFTIDKPVLIRKCEEENQLYQTNLFAAETPVSVAHQELKNMVLKNEMHQEKTSIVKEESPGKQVQKENQKTRHSHRPKIN
jgi:hypothetical protein